MALDVASGSLAAPTPTDRVCACSIEDCSDLEATFPGLRFTPITGDDLPYDDDAFDTAVSFAVLEHVGSAERQRHFLAELARIAHSFVVFTPYRYFPIEMHTLLPLRHWLPVERHRAMLRALGMPFWADEENLNLLSPGSLCPLLPASGHADVRLLWTMGWASNIQIHWRHQRAHA